MNHRARTPHCCKKWVVETWGATSFPVETKGVLHPAEKRVVQLWLAETRGVAFCPVETRCDRLISETTVNMKALIKVFTDNSFIINQN